MGSHGRSARIAVVGAGVSGLTCARRLSNHGVDVAIFDKARGTGGRATTHRNGDRAFDSGAQYFTAREPSFSVQLEEWMAAGVAAEWRGEIVRLRAGEATPGDGSTRRFVGVPGMSALSRHLAGSGRVTTGFRVFGLQPTRDGVTLIGHDGKRETGFDAVLLAAPAPQTQVLARSMAPGLAALAERVPFSACFALMLAYETRLPLPFDGAFVEDSPLAWIARDGSKPGRRGDETWVLHGSPAWSDAHFEDGDESIEHALRAAFAAATRIDVPAPTYSRLHRWRFALPTDPLPDRSLFDPIAGVGACGDWCAGPRIEGAFLSGITLADRVLQWITEVAKGRARRAWGPPRSHERSD